MSEQLKLYKGFDYAALKDIAKNAISFMRSQYMFVGLT